MVEDIELNQIIICDILTELGHQIDIANNGQEALDKLKNNDYSMILMDCHMPVMDGYEATKQIRKTAGNQKSIPIIALTANAFAESKEACFAAGMDDFISKPIDMMELELCIKKVQQNLF